MIKKVIIKLPIIVFGIMTIIGSGCDEEKDTTAPNAPVISSIKLESNNRITVQGSAEAKSIVRVTFPDTNYKETTAASNKSYSVISEQPQPSGNVTATATDAAGNKSTITKKSYIAPSQAKTFQLNIQNIDIRKTSDNSNLYPQGEEYIGTTVTVE